MTWNQPTVLRGEGKRLLRLSLEEFAPTLVKEGLAKAPDIAQVVTGLKELEANDGVLFGMPPIGQLRALR